MKTEPVVLDTRRGMAARVATEVRRSLAEVEQQRHALQQRQIELETYFLAAPSASWEEAADRARYLIQLFADTTAGRDPRRQKIIVGVLEDFRRLAGHRPIVGGRSESVMDGTTRPPRKG